MVLAVLVATPAFAQLPGLELEPYLGVYIPTQSVVDQNIPGVGDVKGSQKTGMALGARLTAWLAGPLGFEINGAYNFSDVEEGDGTTPTDTSAAVWMADGRLILKLLPGPVGIHVTGGVALIGYTGDAYSEVTEGKTNLGGVAGAGLRFKLPGIFAIRGDADVFVYKAQLTGDFGAGETQTNSEWQVDLLLSAGLVIGLL
jgi:hypothetical protein